MGKIGRLKVLDDALKKSFSNVRLDIISIKDYLEKQHDIHNKEISDMQGQIISLRKELFEKTRELEGYARSEEIIRMEKESKELNSKLSEYEAALARMQRSGNAELDRRSLELQKESKQIRSEFYKEIGEMDKKFRDTKLKMAEEQSKLLEQKAKRLDKSLAEVDELKKELRVIVRQAKTKAVSKESIKRVERKVKEKSFFAKFKDAVADFLFEEPLIEQEVMYEEKPKRRKEENKAPGWLVWLIPIFILLLIAGLAYYFYSDEIVNGVGAAVAGFNSLFAPKAPAESGTAVEEHMPSGPVISVYEGDFVDIVPNMSDDDNDRLSYSFTKPLNESGQWQTQTGDEGEYPITVIVSDGEKQTMMNFTLIVQARD